MKYICKRTCYFGRLYEKGETAEFTCENVPEHFEQLAGCGQEKPQPEAGGGAEKQHKELEDMSVFELQKLCREHNIEFEKNWKKEELIAALRG